MPRFLHLADVHLGYDRYDNSQRSRDFFKAFDDALTRYALNDPVDFVVIAGDLFEYRNITPAVLNQALIVLEKLKQAGIPVLLIEGNHDHRPYGTTASWLRYLAEWNWAILLEPDDAAETEDAIYQPWNPVAWRGGYIDLDCGVRVLGSNWYGAAAPQAIARLAKGIQALPPGPPHTVMLLHHGLEGQIARYQGALDPKVLLPLREAGVDYLALGHIHKQYSLDDWIFNPGSVEANSVAENQEQTPRGVYQVELGPNGVIAQHRRDYYQRPIYRLRLEVKKGWTVATVAQQAMDLICAEAEQLEEAIVELRIQGQVGFNRLDVDVRDLRDRLHQLSGALIFLLRYDVTGTEYDTAGTLQGEEPPPRSMIEQVVFSDLLAAQTTYRDRADHLAQGLIDFKYRVQTDQPDKDLYDFVDQLLHSQEEHSQDSEPESVSPSGN